MLADRRKRKTEREGVRERECEEEGKEGEKRRIGGVGLKVRRVAWHSKNNISRRWGKATTA